MSRALGTLAAVALLFAFAAFLIGWANSGGLSSMAGIARPGERPAQHYAAGGASHVAAPAEAAAPSAGGSVGRERIAGTESQFSEMHRAYASAEDGDITQLDEETRTLLAEDIADQATRCTVHASEHFADPQQGEASRLVYNVFCSHNCDGMGAYLCYDPAVTPHLFVTVQCGLPMNAGLWGKILMAWSNAYPGCARILATYPTPGDRFFTMADGLACMAIHTREMYAKLGSVICP